MASSDSRPQLLAAQSSADESSRDNDSYGQKLNTGPRPKRTLIESACAACRKRKSKCDGLRPVCTRCQTLHTECVYEAEEGESRWSALKRRNTALEQELEDLRDVLSWLRAPEQEALEGFRRIRNTTSYNDLLAAARQLRERGVPEAPQTGPPSPGQRLPPFSTLASLSGAGAGQLPSRPLISPSFGSEGSVESYSPGYSPYEREPQPPRPPERPDRS